MNRTILLVLSLLVTAASAAHADNWPQWRGPNNDGISKETGLPASWSLTKNLAWKLDLPGIGSSTPAIWDKRIFLTGMEKDELMMWCVTTDGKLAWKQKVANEVRPPTRKDEVNNEASPSPCTDGKHVWAFFGTGDFVCFDVEGNKVWQFNVQERFQKKFSMYHGVHVTPVLHEDRLYMNVIHTNGYWVFAIDKMTGKEVWKIDRKSDALGESKESYASPCLWKNGKEMNLVVLGADYTTGHRLSDGAELWRITDLNPKSKYSDKLRIIASPLAHEENLYVPTARGGLFVALRPGATGNIKAGSPFEAWRLVKGSPDVPSPLVHDGLVYLQREANNLFVVEAKTGAPVYTERVGEGRYRASPVYADGKIYTVGRDNGTITVLRAGRKFEKLADNDMKDTFTASPAIANGRIYLRGFQALYAVSEGGK